MSSEMKYNPVSYLNRQASILDGNTHYNGRVNLEEPENPDARFQMFEKVAIKNKSTEYREPLLGELENTTLSRNYFSAENIQIVQNGLRAGVYKMSGSREIILPPQNIDILKTIMRHMFLEHAQHKPDGIANQIERLNKYVLDYVVPKVYSESIGYLKYLEDQSRLVVPLELPRQPDRVYKQLELKPYF
jgi:hypothetical protein|tara:strand:+ start:441 stop:1007 length:567 start_codon:yes stop_codon:yes gene_type:complete